LGRGFFRPAHQFRAMRNWLHRSGAGDPPEPNIGTPSGWQLRGAVRDVEPVGWVVVDFETTGTIYPHNRVMEIGAVRLGYASSVSTYGAGIGGTSPKSHSSNSVRRSEERLVV
jgi:hypothetical protein